MTQFNSGYRADLEQATKLRIMSHAFACTAVDIPDEIDARPWLKVENQGQMSSCYGHAASTVCEHINYVASGGDKTQLSRMFCYLTGKQEAGIEGDNGCYIQAGVEALKKRGVCKEATFPYPPEYMEEIPPDAFPEGLQHLVRSHVVLESRPAIVQFNGRGIGGTIAGIPWYESMANHRGPLIERIWGQLLGFHAVPLIGYDRQKRSRIFNSHDHFWGEDGSACVTDEVLDWLIAHANSVFVGVSDMATFSDRKIPDWGMLYGCG